MEPARRARITLGMTDASHELAGSGHIDALQHEHNRERPRRAP